MISSVSEIDEKPDSYFYNLENMTTRKQTLLVCDAPTQVQEQYDLVVYWTSFEEDEKSYSIPKLIESESEALKKKYIEWLHDLGNAHINGRSITEHMEIRKDFSMWWMSLLVEKSQWKSPGIYNAFRLMAFDLLIKNYDVREVVIMIDDESVHNTFLKWGRETETDIKIKVKTRTHSLLMLRKLYELIPSTLQAIVLLFSLIGKNWLIRQRNNKTEYLEQQNSICFISYFDNQAKIEAEQGRFYSYYWTKLHSILEGLDIKINWLHIFYPSSVAPNLEKASKLVRVFNDKAAGKQIHHLLESYIEWRVVKNIIVDYVRLLLISWKLRNVSYLFKVSGCQFSLWYVLKQDWKSSTSGKSSVSNVIFLNLFEYVFSKLSCQSHGYYLLENQAWERSLIYAWRKFGHGKLVGVAHTALRDWDLRHLFPQSEYVRDDNLALPIPDMIALNGDAAIDIYRKVGFPLERIIKVEALRYLYLNSLHNIIDNTSSSNTIRLLVLGDYDPATTFRQMNLLNKCLVKFTGNIDILIKPHPNCPVNPDQLSLKNMRITDASLEKLVNEYDIAYTSNATTAAVDVYLTGKRVITILDPVTFNMSPLRGYHGIKFVFTSDELLNAINEKYLSNKTQQINYFCNEPDLVRWRKLIEF